MLGIFYPWPTPKTSQTFFLGTRDSPTQSVEWLILLYDHGTQLVWHLSQVELFWNYGVFLVVLKFEFSLSHCPPHPQPFCALVTFQSRVFVQGQVQTVILLPGTPALLGLQVWATIPNFCFLFFLMVLEFEPQAFTFATHVLYYLSHSASFFMFDIFEIGSLKLFCLA
jgi:hypothetical protein